MRRGWRARSRWWPRPPSRGRHGRRSSTTTRRRPRAARARSRSSSAAATATLQDADLSGGAFTPWRSLGGYLDSGPGRGRPHARRSPTSFVRGGDGALYQKSFTTSSGWTGWIGSAHPMLSAPTVSIRRGSGIIDLFWRGADNGIEAKSWVPGSGWTDVNNTQLDPGPDRVGAGGRLAQRRLRRRDRPRHRRPRLPQHLQRLGLERLGQIPGGMKTQHAPAATVRTLNTMDIFVRSRHGEVRWITWDGAAWSGWKTVPGGVDSGPAVVADTSSRMWLFARRGGEVVYNVYDAGKGPQNGWRGWKLLHPPPPPPPPPPGVRPAAGRLTGARASSSASASAPRLTGRARRTDGAPLVSATITVLARARAAGRARRPPSPTASTRCGSPPARRGGSTCEALGARRLLARLHERAGPDPRRGDAEGHAPRAPGRHGALPRPPEGPAGARARQARGAAGVRRRPLAHVRAAALAPRRALPRGLPAAPHVRAADVPLPRPRAARERATRTSSATRAGSRCACAEPNVR